MSGITKDILNNCRSWFLYISRKVKAFYLFASFGQPSVFCGNIFAYKCLICDYVQSWTKWHVRERLDTAEFHRFAFFCKQSS